MINLIEIGLGIGLVGLSIVVLGILLVDYLGQHAGRIKSVLLFWKKGSAGAPLPASARIKIEPVITAGSKPAPPPEPPKEPKHRVKPEQEPQVIDVKAEPVPPPEPPKAPKQAKAKAKAKRLSPKAEEVLAAAAAPASSPGRRRRVAI